MHQHINKSFNYSTLHFSKFRLFKIVKNTLPCKRFSAQVKNESERCNDLNISKKIIENFLIPTISSSRLKEIHDVTGVTLKMGLVSWIKISTQTLKITDWNLKKYTDFKDTDEASIIQIASDLKQILPKSDLYVMEKTRSREATKVLNDIRLSSMLMVFLNDLKDGVQGFDKVVFQKENVLNILHNLSVGNERVSARKVFETILFGINEKENGYGNFHSLKNIDLEMLEFYDKSSLAAQECLSFVLLLTLSFIDVFIYENVESLRKIQMQYKFRKIKR